MDWILGVMFCQNNQTRHSDCWSVYLPGLRCMVTPGCMFASICLAFDSSSVSIPDLRLEFLSPGWDTSAIFMLVSLSAKSFPADSLFLFARSSFASLLARFLTRTLLPLSFCSSRCLAFSFCFLIFRYAWYAYAYTIIVTFLKMIFVLVDNA